MKTNFVLIGFMGVGKTSLGKKLAERYEMEFIDTDKEIEKLTGMTVSQIFNRFGEVRFRSEENLVIAKVAQKNNCVISAGGGAVINPDNVEKLQENGLLICLTATPEVIQERVSKRGGRPLLEKDKSITRIKELLVQRQGFYDKADFTIDTTDLDQEETLAAILAFLAERGYEYGNASC